MTAETATVLLLDDEELLRELAQEALEDAHYTVVSAPNGEAGMDVLTQGTVHVEALLTDIDMGQQRLSGWDVARMARRLQPGLPVIYMTGASGNDWAAMGVAGSLLLAKPFTLRQLVAAVAHLVPTHA